MRFSLLIVAALLAAGVAGAGNWTTLPGAGEPCDAVGPGSVCFNQPAGVTTPVIRIAQCKQATLAVAGANASVVPTACFTAACTFEVPLFDAPLTGNVGTAWGAINTPFDYIRATDNNTGVTLALICR